MLFIFIRMKIKAVVFYLACVMLLALSSDVFSQTGDLQQTQSLVRNLICLLFWVIPFIMLLCLVAASFIILVGGVERRIVGKRLIKNSFFAFIILMTLVFFVSLALPDVNVEICLGAIPVVDNQAPVAEARAGFDPSAITEKSVEVTVGDSTYFSAELSGDPDGFVAEYMWDFGDAEYDDAIFTEHTYTRVGEYVVKLRVRDDKGDLSVVPSTVRVVVNPSLSVDGDFRAIRHETITTTTKAASSTTSSSSSSSSSTSTTSTTTTTLAAAKITLLFIPITWSAGWSAFDTIVDDHVSTLVEAIPLKDCPERVKVIKIHSSCDVAISVDGNKCLYDESDRILDEIIQCGVDSGESYDYVIGVEDDVNLCGGYAGFSSAGRGVVFVKGVYTFVTTHELGHEWGLDDEYLDMCRCFSNMSFFHGDNCLDQSLDGDAGDGGYGSEYCAGGSLCPASYTLSCKGNLNSQGGRCYMSSGGNPPKEFCEHCLNHLKTLSFLTCT